MIWCSKWIKCGSKRKMYIIHTQMCSSTNQSITDLHNVSKILAKRNLQEMKEVKIQLLMQPPRLQHTVECHYKLSNITWYYGSNVVNPATKHKKIWACFLSLARSKLRLCSVNHRAGYVSNIAYDWLSTVWAYSEQETENRPPCCCKPFG